ncbi:MAG: FHA domain-containing protein [Actinomycetota bacterium]
MVACNRCGHRNAADDRFCASCGTALRDDTAAMAGLDVEDGGVAFPFPDEPLAAGQALLLVRTGAAAGSTYLLDREVTTLGRDPGSDVFLDDVTVSRKHAEIRRQADGFYVHDLGSLNGSYVGRERVDITKLADGDEVQIGRYKLTVFVGDR